jgi:transposase
MAGAWLGPITTDNTLAFGPLALIAPLLQRLDVADIVDRHLPPDPQLAYSHGRVLSLLLAARLCQPTALSNIPTWARRSGADLLWDLPADDLNDDRLGRALDAFFSQRHSIQATVAAQALQLAELTGQRLHFDPTHLIFAGAYESSQPRPDPLPWPPERSADVEPAHITHGYAADKKILHVGLSCAVDHLGALPLLGHCLDGNLTNHTAIAQQTQWMLEQHLLRPGGLLVSDRGTFSLEHVARLHRHDCHVLCSAPWADFQALYDAQAAQLVWRRASFLSVEQQRRRDSGSALPHEHYDLAVLQHSFTDPQTQEAIPCRLLFVYSSADAAICCQTRAQDIQRLHRGLEQIAQTVARGPAQTTTASITRRLVTLFGRRAAARFFQWELLPLSAAEQAALPPPGPGCRRATLRLSFTFDATAAAAAAVYDGLSVLVTTAPRTQSADSLFTQYKEQNYVELSHHQWKTPLRVRPVFLKAPRRVEALVCLLQIALTAYQLLERFYRQRVASDAPVAEQRLTSESLLREFHSYGLITRQTRLGRVVEATRLSQRQQHILRQLRFPTPAQLLAQVLPPLPHAG